MGHDSGRHRWLYFGPYALCGGIADRSCVSPILWNRSMRHCSNHLFHSLWCPWLYSSLPCPSSVDVWTRFRLVATAFLVRPVYASTGVLWNVGNVLSIIAIPILGYCVAYPIMQCAVFIAGIWGIGLFQVGPPPSSDR